MNTIIEIEKISIIKDGGTSCWINPDVRKSIKTMDDAKNCQQYYLDNRIGSKTKGELFDRYPGDSGATMLDKSNFKFL
jgi:hypothetical protein